MFRVIIAGTRYFNDYALLCEYADKVLARKRAEGEIASFEAILCRNFTIYSKVSLICVLHIGFLLMFLFLLVFPFFLLSSFLSWRAGGRATAPPAQY